jgi:hypothetical protein
MSINREVQDLLRAVANTPGWTAAGSDPSNWLLYSVASACTREEDLHEIEHLQKALALAAPSPAGQAALAELHRVVADMLNSKQPTIDVEDDLNKLVDAVGKVGPWDCAKFTPASWWFDVLRQYRFNVSVLAKLQAKLATLTPGQADYEAVHDLAILIRGGLRKRQPQDSLDVLKAQLTELVSAVKEAGANVARALAEARAGE